MTFGDRFRYAPYSGSRITLQDYLMRIFVGTLLFGILGLVVGSVCIKALGGLNILYSEGSRSGTVTKISRKGMVWQTYEGELDLHRLVNTGGEDSTLTADIFYFSVSDPGVAQQVMEAEQKGHRTTLTYRQYLFRGWKYGATGYDVTGVKVSNQPVQSRTTFPN